MSLEIVSAVSAIAAVIGSLVPLVTKYYSMRKEYREKSTVELRLGKEGEDGETTKITIDSKDLRPDQVERLLQTLRDMQRKAPAAAPSVPPEQLK